MFVIVGRASEIEPDLIGAISHARTNRLLIDRLPRRIDLQSLARTLPRLNPTNAGPLSDRRVLAAAPSTECDRLAVEPDVLSKREVDVTKLLTRGMTNREIANKLFIAERTAEGHVERIRNKLGVRSRTEVALWAARRGLAE